VSAGKGKYSLLSTDLKGEGKEVGRYARGNGLRGARKRGEEKRRGKEGRKKP